MSNGEEIQAEFVLRRSVTEFFDAQNPFKRAGDDFSVQRA
jgi:hypothetical protein